MAKVILRTKGTEETIIGGIPYYGYGVDADTYEEAYAIAKRMFNEDLNRDVEEQVNQIAEMLESNVYGGDW